MSGRESNGVLCFRVMRLTRPLFAKQPCELAEFGIDNIAGSLTAGDAALRSDLDGVPIKHLSLDETSAPADGDDVFNSSHISSDPVRVKVGGPGELLNFTSSFGTTYLGETFSVHVNLYNRSNETCHNVEMKVAIYNRTDWITLFSSNSSTGASIPSFTPSGADLGQRTTSGVDLAPGQSISAVVYHELKELGVHALRCTATYRPSPTSGGAQRPGDTQNLGTTTFARVYEFKSNKPLDVKKKFSAVQPDGSVFMEAQVQNLTANPIFLERVIFEPSANVSVVDLSCLDNSLPTCNPLRLLRPENAQQFLYQLIPHPGSNLAAQSAKPRLTPSSQPLQQPPVTAGRLDITWRSMMGERGRLQTSSLKYEVPVFSDIQVKTVELPASVNAIQPFQIKIEIINRCATPLDLTLNLHDGPQHVHRDLPTVDSTPPKAATNKLSTCSFPLVWMGLTTKKLGGVSPGSSIPLTLDMMATVPGLQVISGLAIHESTSGRDYEFNNLGQVLVCVA